MKLDKTIFLFTILLFLIPSDVMAGEIVVTDADSVWTPDLTVASPDVTDSTDAPSQNLITWAFVSHADSVWAPDLIVASPDVIDSTDAPVQNLITWAFVSHADGVWNTELTGNGWEAPIEPEKWSFALITDLHIGRGYPDYGGEGWDDSGTTGQNYYLTERLEAVVEEIRRLRDEHNIKFVAVLGDITDSGEYSEFEKAKEILDDLNYDANGDGTLDMVYIPLIGNHDVWPIIRTVDPEGGEITEITAPHPSTYFYEVFENQFDLLRNNLPSWEGSDGVIHMNYNFKLGEIRFISLDFVDRGGPSSKAILHDETKQWLQGHLQKNEPTIILAHHPLIGNETLEPAIKSAYGDIPGEILEEIISEIMVFESGDIRELGEVIRNSEAELLPNFAGHIHGFYNELFAKEQLYFPIFFPIFWNANITYEEPVLSNIPIVTTEASMVGSNRLVPKGIVRIVKIEDNNISDYSLIKGEEEFRALNPYFKEIEWSPRIEIEWGFPPKPKPIWEVEFELYAFTELYPLDYTLDFGDGSQKSDEIPKRLYPPIEVEHNYPKEGGTYNIEWITKKTTPLIEENITRNITLPHWQWGPFTLSPVEIILTDPDGLQVSKQLNEIPGAIYYETDLNEDGSLDDIIILSDHKIGDYLMTITPEPDANLTDTYTFGVLTEDNTIIFLAENVQINAIPNLPYIIRSTETEMIPIIPATIDFGPDTFNLKSEGQWVTTYIELPVGHGYDLSVIDLTSLKLNGQVPAEVKPIEISDYDKDGISDLMIKFQRDAIKNILAIGDKVKIIISGELIDGRVFEGKDIIKVIHTL